MVIITLIYTLYLLKRVGNPWSMLPLNAITARLWPRFRDMECRGNITLCNDLAGLHGLVLVYGCNDNEENNSCDDKTSRTVTYPGTECLNMMISAMFQGNSTCFSTQRIILLRGKSRRDEIKCNRIGIELSTCIFITRCFSQYERGNFAVKLTLEKL